MMNIHVEIELTNLRFAELGDPLRLFSEPARGFVAIASRLPPLGYPGHYLHPDQQPPINRLSVYDQGSGRLLGLVATKFPVNDVAFDPTNDSLLIATGSYDGGWYFSGYFLRFNWRTGEVEQLLGQGRDAVACRFNEDGGISVLLRPANEEEFLEENLDAWSIVIGLHIDSGPGPWAGQAAEVSRTDARLDGLRPSNPSDHGFRDVVITSGPENARFWRDEALAWLRSMDARLYHGIWNLHWIDNDSFAVATHGRAIEIRDVTGRVLHEESHPGTCVEIIVHPTLGLLFHVQENGFIPNSIEAVSELWQWKDDHLHLLRRFDRLYAFSFDCGGMGLGIDLSWNRERQDLLLDRVGCIAAHPDCGRSDRIGPASFPHGLDGIYCVRRTGEKTFRDDDHRLLLLEGSDRFINLREWDPQERDFYPVVSIAYSPGRVLAAGPVWDRTAHANLGLFLELVDLQTGDRKVSIPLQGSPTCIALSEDKRIALVGFSDASLRCFDLERQLPTGEIKLDQRGLASVPLSIAIRGHQVLIGTQDGRIVRASLAS